MSRLPIIINTKENLSITIKKECVTKEAVGVVINSTTDSLNLNSGVLSASILKAAGNIIQEECKKKSPTGIRRGQIVETTAGNMPAKVIYHGSLSPWMNGNGEADLLAFVRCFLDKADIENQSSMSIPAISTGNLAFPPNVVANLMHREICNFSQAHPNTTLKDIRIVLISEPQLTAFTDYFSGLIAGSPKSPSTQGSTASSPAPRPASRGLVGMLSKLLWPSFHSGLTATDRSENPHTRESSQHGSEDNMTTLKTAHGISVIVKKGNIAEAKTDSITNVTTKNLRLTHGAISSSILKAAGKTIEQECTRNAPNGIEYGELVKTGSGQLACKSIYHGAIREWSSGCGETDIRALLTKIYETADADGATSVAVPSIGTGLLLGYPPDIVIKCIMEELETFNAANQSTSIVSVEIILFNRDVRTLRAFQSYLSGKYNTAQPDVNKNLETPSIPVPSCWSAMSDKLYKLECLPNTSEEYQQVYKRFTSKGGPQNVKKIQRVQCPNMYQIFILRGRQMEKTISDKAKFRVEETLYHGTSHDVLDKINLLGFNRSFGGKNATVLGYGTYFAREASYSCSEVYSPVDGDGYKHVYQCRVLTGEYTKGSSDLKVPPPKDPSDPNVLFDTVVNNTSTPTVFVVFYDGQAYPEYLITFKK